MRSNALCKWISSFIIGIDIFPEVHSDKLVETSAHKLQSDHFIKFKVWRLDNSQHFWVTTYKNRFEICRNFQWFLIEFSWAPVVINKISGDVYLSLHMDNLRQTIFLFFFSRHHRHWPLARVLCRTNYSWEGKKKHSRNSKCSG